MDKIRPLRRWHPIVLVTSVLGIVSIALLFWMHQINKREDADILLADTIMDLEVQVATSHFELGESYGERFPGVREKALSDLENAIAEARAIRGGGKSKFGPDLLVPESGQFSAKAEDIVRRLDEMQEIAGQLGRLPPGTPFPESLDERLDRGCNEILADAKVLELEAEKRGAVHRDDSRRLVYWIFFSWSGVVVVSIIGLWGQERQRRRAEVSILSLNAHLESQTEELTRHREHFMELVEERTERLKLANEGLRLEMAERSDAERALRKSEERYRMLIETMDEGLTILDEKGAITYVNDKLCEILGRTRGEILGHPLVKFIAFRQDIEIANEYLKEINTHDHSRFEAAFFRKDGNVVYAITSLKRIREASSDGKGCFAVITDISEKVTLQANSLRTAHLASLGEMAAGVAHEINNPINGIINYACMLAEGRYAVGREKDIATRIQTEGRRIAGIVRDLLLFGREGKKEKVPVDVTEVLSSTLNITGAGLRKDGIEIRASLAPDLPNPIVDPQELQQVFINILSNAQHALNQKYPDQHPNKILQINMEKARIDHASYLRIAFKDWGVGIPARIIDKVKQPFFSTRPKGRGTGLGLSISEGIISECGGRLSIESAEGEFTNIEIDLPAGN